ncbi:MAG: hypothetical protein ABEH43_09740, partial [Flavobacteriales bacterium]
MINNTDFDKYLVLQINGKENPVFPDNLSENEEIDVETVRNPIKVEEISDILLQLAERAERQAILLLAAKEESDEKNKIVDYYDNLAYNSYL